MNLRDSVRLAWYDFIKQYEGVCYWIYLDSHRPDTLPTTGVGNLIGTHADLSTYGYSLPFRKKDGRYATEHEIGNEFKKMKALGRIGDGFAYKPHASLFLDDSVVRWLVENKLKENQSTLDKYFPHRTEAPVGVELVINNMAWLMGPSFSVANGGWPNL